MRNPLLLFRVGHMASYDGPGDIHGGGAHVVEGCLEELKKFD